MPTKLPTTPNNPHLTDEFIQSVYGQMLRFANNRLAGSTAAEDVVQEVFSLCYVLQNSVSHL